MKLDIKKDFSNSSERVKSLDFHPTQPWLLSTLYTGKIEIWNYETKRLVRGIDVTDSPVRAGKFIARQNWCILGCDDFKVRVFNYNTGEKVHEFEAHPDYVRCIIVHPILPYILTSSDDGLVKLWNWEHNWSLQQEFEAHESIVMSVAINPKDPTVFATASLDRTVKIWTIGKADPNLTILAHETEGVNFVEYYPHQDKPYLITCSDDCSIKIWDYQTKSCVSTMEGHDYNVSFATFHPTLPIIISGGEDSTVKIWSSITYQLESSMKLNMERCWSVATQPSGGDKNIVAIGCDSGFAIISMGNNDPIYSMDSQGKLVWCSKKGGNNSEVYTAVIKQKREEEENEDEQEGQHTKLQTKELGSVDVYPQSLKHSPNGRNVAVVGDGEFVIYTALAWRNKAFGNCKSFAWGADSNTYCLVTLEGSVEIYKDFKKVDNFPNFVEYDITECFDGPLLSLKTAEGDLLFVDWDNGEELKSFELNAEKIIWSKNEELVLIYTEQESGYVLEYNKDLVGSEEEEFLSVLYEFNDSIKSGEWVGDVFLYTTAQGKLSYFIGGSSYTVAHFDQPKYVVGYLANDNKVYVCDRNMQITSYPLSINVMEFQTWITRGAVDEALKEILPKIQNKKDLLTISKFLETQELFQEAYEITPDFDQKYILAVKLNLLKDAYDLLAQEDGTRNEHKWKLLGDTSLNKFNFKLAIECFKHASDFESLLLVYSSFNMKDQLIALGAEAEKEGKFNIAFNSYWCGGEIEKITELLAKSGNIPQAALFKYTYGEDTTLVVEKWRETLEKEGSKNLANRLLAPKPFSKHFEKELQEESLIDLENDIQEDVTEETQESVVKEENDKEEEEEEEAPVTEENNVNGVVDEHLE
ncbi:hypothetical protein QEN19_000337 [Hanseniaspora menglaensis]